MPRRFDHNSISLIFSRRPYLSQHLQILPGKYSIDLILPLTAIPFDDERLKTFIENADTLALVLGVSISSVLAATTITRPSAGAKDRIFGAAGTKSWRIARKRAIQK
jgi:hypothetical protein